MAEWKRYPENTPEEKITYQITVLGENGTSGVVKAFYLHDYNDCEGGWRTEDGKFYSVYTDWDILFAELDGKPNDRSVYADFLDTEYYRNAGW